MKTMVLTGGGTAGHIYPLLAVKERVEKEYNFVYNNNLLYAIIGEKRLKNGELYIHWKNKKVYSKER